MRSCYSVSTDFASAANAQIAIEAVFEDIAVKITVFQKLQEVMSANAILASNTSYLDINVIAAALDDPSRLIGLHFFVPAHIMKLLEIVKGDVSAPTALASGFRLAKQLGKIPVVAGYVTDLSATGFWRAIARRPIFCCFMARHLHKSTKL